jgi:hypothetical protein
MSNKIHTFTISREALMKAVAQIVKDQSVGLANMECIGLNAVLVAQTKGGKVETFPLDTIEAELVPAAKPKPVRTGKVRLAAVDGVAL